MKMLHAMGLLAACCSLAAAQPQGPMLRDLADKNPRTLTKEEVTQLLPGAKMSRTNPRGDLISWKNEPGGSFIANHNTSGRGGAARAQRSGGSAPGKWHLSDDGRYCVMIEWQGTPTEEWCRFVIQTSDGYYMAKSTTMGTEIAHKIEIKK
jgi:hypothetical protein